MAAFFIAVPVVGAACGADEGARTTLPPIVTTTTTTTVLATTTTYPEVYTIQPGETLGKIALKFGTTIEVLVQINGIRNRNDVQAGQKLKLPPNPALTSTTAAGGGTTSLSTAST
jgi:LysM repeat protein